MRAKKTLPRLFNLIVFACSRARTACKSIPNKKEKSRGWSLGILEIKSICSTDGNDDNVSSCWLYIVVVDYILPRCDRLGKQELARLWLYIAFFTQWTQRQDIRLELEREREREPNWICLYMSHTHRVRPVVIIFVGVSPHCQLCLVLLLVVVNC